MWVALGGIWFCLPMGPRVLICILQGEGRAGTWTPGAAVPVLGFRTCHEQGMLFDLPEFQNNACGLRAPKSSSSKQAFFLSFIPLIQFPTGYLSLHIPSLCWKHMLSKFSLKISYRTHQVHAELPFFLKILTPTSLFLPDCHHTFHCFFLVCCINHSLLPVLPLLNTHSFYQTIADTARATVYKCRALIFCVSLLYTKSKSDSSTHTNVVYLQTLST